MAEMALVEGEGYKVPRFKKGEKIDCWAAESCEIVRVVNAEVTSTFPTKQTRPTGVSYLVKIGESSAETWIQDNEVYGPANSGKMFVFDVTE